LLSFKLGALDLTPIFPGAKPMDPIWETLDLAPALETIGYSRYWLAEHHGDQIANSSPEILVSILAGLTERMHIGTAGILLRLHSPLKVALNFRLLQGIYPGRIDLGVARGMTSARVSAALRRNESSEDDFEDRVLELFSHLRSQSSLVVNPAGVGIPEIWMLGSSDRSMRIAAEQGTAFCFASFLNAEMDLPQLFESYRTTFKPRPAFPEPKGAIAFAGICAPNEGEARALMQGQRPYSVIPTFVGGQASGLKYLQGLHDSTGVNEFVFLDMCRSYDKRLNSYRLLAETLQQS
jgi:luciferase family oxidoreductase group 1